MNKMVLVLSVVLGAFASATEINQTVLLNNYEHVIDMADNKGQTYLSFMEKVVKPAIDEVATKGYKVVSPEAVESVYQNVDKKVQRVVTNNGGIANVKKIVRALEGKTVNLNNLPAEIAAVDRSVDRYDLSTFIGLASGGGVVVRHYEGNYSYNVHYDTTEQRSGRSFGASPIRGANDASDKAYLDDLNAYSRESGARNLPQFNRTLLESLLNSDGSNYPKVIAEGQNVLTDFLAVYTAEQARNLMDGQVEIHWDAALLEVTLLAGFHAGQREFKLYYLDPKAQKVSFTNRVYNQTPCAVPETQRQASMRDYWQFSRRITDTKNCRRSGINITKSEFRRLGTEITAYMEKKNPKLVQDLRAAMGTTARQGSNVYYALSQLLINERTPKSMSVTQVNKIVRAWTAFLDGVKASANDITRELSASSNRAGSRAG